MQLTARCRTFWHRLQEQGGIHNSHAEILLAREKAKWEEARASEQDVAKAPAAAAASPVAAPEAAAAAAEAAPGPAASERNPDEAWIDTARCPSCNECQNINDKMFKYNDKQAYIVDVKLGTYRQMVDAAEACQVAIIHPGKPWNPNEPGLAELVARAEAFQ
jgi:ferredoxin